MLIKEIDQCLTSDETVAYDHSSVDSEDNPMEALKSRVRKLINEYEALEAEVEESNG
jgi:hypothetical protein